jgi:hypothetical protein
MSIYDGAMRKTSANFEPFSALLLHYERIRKYALVVSLEWYGINMERFHNYSEGATDSRKVINLEISDVSV